MWFDYCKQPKSWPSGQSDQLFKIMICLALGGLLSTVAHFVVTSPHHSTDISDSPSILTIRRNLSTIRETDFSPFLCCQTIEKSIAMKIKIKRVIITGLLPWLCICFVSTLRCSFYQVDTFGCSWKPFIKRKTNILGWNLDAFDLSALMFLEKKRLITLPQGGRQRCASPPRIREGRVT